MRALKAQSRSSLHWVLGVVTLGFVVATVAWGEHTRYTKDPDTGVETWEIQDKGVILRLAQILPDQVRAFYLARGFSVPATEALARSCVFQTVLRNESAPTTISFNLAQWRVLTETGEHTLKLQRDWEKEWEQHGVSDSARLAFAWALFPTEHAYEVGDWNMGMTTYALPPAARFDLRFVYTIQGRLQAGLIRGLRCATDVETARD